MTESPYRRGARDGFATGLYFSIMFFASIFTVRLPLLGAVSGVMMLAVPALAYMLMRRYERALGPAASFAMLWMQGVMMFMCGMILAGALLVVYMRWIDPGLIMSQLETMAALAGTAPGTVIDEAATVAAQMLEAGFIPTPTSIVVEMIMLSVVTGSGLTLLLSLLMAVRRKARGRAAGQRNVNTL